MKNYGQFTMGELRSRIEKKYETLLTSEKLVYVVAGNYTYYGSDYGLLSSESLKDFNRADLEEVLSNKFSAVKNVIELDDIIVIHDGYAEKREFNKNGEYIECVYTGNSRYGEDEVIYGQGSWSWVKTEHPVNTYMRKAYSQVKTFIPVLMNELNWTEEKTKSVLHEYYDKPIYKHMASSRKVINTGNPVIVLNFEGEDLPYRASFAMPKLEVYKLSEESKNKLISKAKELKEKETIRIRKFILRDTISQLEDGKLPFMYFSYRNSHYGEYGHDGYTYANYYEKDYLEVIKALGINYKCLVFEKDYMYYTF